MAGVSTVFRQRGMYASLLARYLRGGGTRDLVRSRFPFALADPPAPRVVAIELTNVCNLRCTYCDAQQRAQMRPRGYMAESTLRNVVSQVRELRVQRVRFIGAGEATMHPQFARLVRLAAGCAPVVTVTTNGQLLSEDNCAALTESADIVEVSVDSDHAAAYERLRVGAKFPTLLRNLERLRNTAASRNARLLLHIRLMIRPSDQQQAPRLTKFWQGRGDTVSTQRINDYSLAGGDMFPASSDPHLFRRCPAPFKLLDVNWNGDVPLCDSSALQAKDPAGVILGNVDVTPLKEIWICDLMKQYRRGHRQREFGLAPLCQGCPCVWR